MVHCSSLTYPTFEALSFVPRRYSAGIVVPSSADQAYASSSGHGYGDAEVDVSE